MDYSGYDFSGNDSPWSNYSNALYDTGSWNNSFNTSFDDYTTALTEPSYWASIVDFAKSQGGASLIGGAASGIGQGISAMMSSDLAEQTAKDTKEYRDRQLELMEKSMEQSGEEAAAALAYQYAVLQDKIDTRAKHNATINTAPSPLPKVKIG